jgi:hypothetical protein
VRVTMCWCSQECVGSHERTLSLCLFVSGSSSAWRIALAWKRAFVEVTYLVMILNDPLYWMPASMLFIAWESTDVLVSVGTLANASSTQSSSAHIYSFTLVYRVSPALARCVDPPRDRLPKQPAQVPVSTGAATSVQLSPAAELDHAAGGGGALLLPRGDIRLPALARSVVERWHTLLAAAHTDRHLGTGGVVGTLLLPALHAAASRPTPLPLRAPLTPQSGPRAMAPCSPVTRIHASCARARTAHVLFFDTSPPATGRPPAACAYSRALALLPAAPVARSLLDGDLQCREEREEVGREG